jgi:hypothetical protein
MMLMKAHPGKCSSPAPSAPLRDHRSSSIAKIVRGAVRFEGNLSPDLAFLDRKALKLGALLHGIDQPVRLAAATRPRLRAVFRIAIFGDAGPFR